MSNDTATTLTPEAYELLKDLCGLSFLDEAPPAAKEPKQESVFDQQAVPQDPFASLQTLINNLNLGALQQPQEMAQTTLKASAPAWFGVPVPQQQAPPSLSAESALPKAAVAPRGTLYEPVELGLPNSFFQHARENGMRFLPIDDPDVTCFAVPVKAVPFIKGRGLSGILSMQAQTGCVIMLQPTGEGKVIHDNPMQRAEAMKSINGRLYGCMQREARRQGTHKSREMNVMAQYHHSLRA